MIYHVERFRDMIDDICRVANVSMSLVDTKYQTLYLYEKESAQDSVSEAGENALSSL